MAKTAKKVSRKKKNSSRSQESHPSHKALSPRINRARGQLNAVSRMIEEGEYCPKIIQQLRAVTSALKSVEALILEKHLNHCVSHAVDKGPSATLNKKIKEVLDLFKNY